jgi:hypothetical protein
LSYGPTRVRRLAPARSARSRTVYTVTRLANQNYSIGGGRSATPAIVGITSADTPGP